MGEADIH